ncbi:MAG: hypothetical protein H7328_10355 [Bdellovibrio sp.]|nr:hypothetical protein [Bdellovibrio sp.]
MCRLFSLRSIILFCFLSSSAFANSVLSGSYVSAPNCKGLIPSNTPVVVEANDGILIKYLNTKLSYSSGSTYSYRGDTENYIDGDFNAEGSFYYIEKYVSGNGTQFDYLRFEIIKTSSGAYIRSDNISCDLIKK